METITTMQRATLMDALRYAALMYMFVANEEGPDKRVANNLLQLTYILCVSFGINAHHILDETKSIVDKAIEEAREEESRTKVTRRMRMYRLKLLEAALAMFSLFEMKPLEKHGTTCLIYLQAYGDMTGRYVPFDRASIEEELERVRKELADADA